MEVIVDRIENDYLVLELPNSKHINVLKELIPDCQEGDIINIKIDYERRKKRENEVKILSDKLFLETKN